MNVCVAYDCPTGYTKKDPLPNMPASATTEICCDKTANTVVIVLIIVAALITVGSIGIAIIMKKKKHR